MEHTLLASTRPVQLPQVMLAGMLCMAMLGAATTLYGPTLIYVATEAKQPLATVGIIFAMHGLGFFGSTFVANRLARRLEMRRAALVGCVLVGLGVLGYALLPFPFNVASALSVGFGAGLLEIFLNRLVELMAVDKPAAALTRLHSTWGVGAVLIPLAVAGVVQIGFSWRAAGAVLLVYIVCVLAVVWRWPEFAVDHGPPMDWHRVPWRSVMFFIVMFVVYVGVESAVGGWATTFFARLGQGLFIGALATSFFFLMLSIGRVLLASSVERFGYGATIRWSTGLGALALLLTFAPQFALIGFGLAGLAFSVVFTTMLAWSARRHPALRAQMASLAIASAGLGGMFVPSVIGIAVSAIGAWSLTPILIGTALTVLGVSFLEPDRI